MDTYKHTVYVHIHICFMYIIRLTVAAARGSLFRELYNMLYTDISRLVR